MEDTDTHRKDAWISNRTVVKRIMIIQFFLLGTEFSTIMPSVVFYLIQLHVQNLALFLGLMISAYALSGMIFSLILGRLADKTLKFRLLIVLVNFVTLSGNALYAIGYSPYLLILARFLSGVVESVYPITYGEFARCYSTWQLPRHTGHLMASFCLGFCVGPGFNLLPTNKVFHLGSFSISFTNAPGVILFCGYGIQLIVSCAGLKNLALDKQRSGIDVEAIDKESQDTDESIALIINEAQETGRKPLSEGILELRPWCDVLCGLLKKRKIQVLLFGQFVWSMTLVSGIVSLPVAANKLLQLNHRHISLIYLGCGIYMSVTMYTSSYLLSKYSTVTISIAAFLANVLAFSCLYITYLIENFTIAAKATIFSLFTAFFFLSWFFNSIAIKTTVSRHVPMEDQSFSQGVFSFMEYLTACASSLISGVSFEILSWECTWLIFFNVIAAILFSIFYLDLDVDKKEKGMPYSL